MVWPANLYILNTDENNPTTLPNNYSAFSGLPEQIQLTTFLLDLHPLKRQKVVRCQNPLYLIFRPH